MCLYESSHYIFHNKIIFLLKLDTLFCFLRYISIKTTTNRIEISCPDKRKYMLSSCLRVCYFLLPLLVFWTNYEFLFLLSVNTPSAYNRSACWVYMQVCVQYLYIFWIILWTRQHYYVKDFHYRKVKHFITDGKP